MKKNRLLKWILYKFFYVVINDNSIDQDFILRLSQMHLNTPRTKWKNKYLFIKLSYCVDMYKAIHGSNKYSELANRLFKEIDAEEEKSRKKIAEQMTRFFKSAK